MPRQAIGANKGNDLEAVIQGVSAILKREHSNLVFNSLVVCVDRVAAQGQVAMLESNLTKLIDEKFNFWMQELQKQAGIPLITLFSSQYDDLKVYLNLIPKIFLHYDRVITVGKKTAFEIIRQSYFNIIFSKNDQINAIFRNILKQITYFRKKTEHDYSISKNIIHLVYSYENYPNCTRLSSLLSLVHRDTETYYDEAFGACYAGNFPPFLNSAIEILEHEKSIINTLFQGDHCHQILHTAFGIMLFSREDQFFKGNEPPVTQALIAQDLRPIKWLIEHYTQFGQNKKRLISVCASYVQTQMLGFSSKFDKSSDDQAGKRTTAKAPAKKPPTAKAPSKKPTPTTQEEGPKAVDSDAKKKNSSNTPEMVKYLEELMHLTLNLQKAYHTVFLEVEGAISELDRNIDTAWNDPVFKVADNFALFIDHHIKSEFKNYNEELLGPFPQLCSIFVKRMADKSFFKITYETYFLRRLIKMGEKLREIEGPVIQAIRRTITDFEKNFERYIERVKESQNILNEFKLEQQQKNQNKSKSIDKQPDVSFNPIIFDSNNFTLEKIEVQRIPTFLSETHIRFTESYTQKRPNHVLVMLSDLSVVEFRWLVPPNRFYKTGPRNYTVSCDILCGTILQTIWNNKNCRLLDLYNNIPENHDQIKNYIRRLCQKDKQILKRTKADDDESNLLRETDSFSFNPNFFNPNARVQISPPDYHKDKIPEKQLLAAETIIKAAAIRILKANNVIAQVDLENEVTTAVSQFFRANITQVRRVIDSLQIGDEIYCELDKHTGNLTYKK